MKVGIKGMLATTAAAAALFAGAEVALADGMPGGPGYAYAPAVWSGAYVGFESGLQWDDFRIEYLAPPNKVSPHQDGDLTIGFFGGYQHQFGPVVVGVEANIISNEFDQPASTACPNAADKCQARISDLITVGPRVGWAVGHFMPYVTGGWATASETYQATTTTAGGGTGPTFERYDTRKDGYYIGGGLDWKLSHMAVVGIEYRHTDLGTTDEIRPWAVPGPGLGSSSDTNKLRAESDSIMVRGSLLFGRDYAPLK